MTLSVRNRKKLWMMQSMDLMYLLFYQQEAENQFAFGQCRSADHCLGFLIFLLCMHALIPHLSSLPIPKERDRRYRKLKGYRNYKRYAEQYRKCWISIKCIRQRIYRRYVNKIQEIYQIQKKNTADTKLEIQEIQDQFPVQIQVCCTIEDQLCCTIQDQVCCTTEDLVCCTIQDLVSRTLQDQFCCTIQDQVCCTIQDQFPVQYRIRSTVQYRIRSVV